MIKKRGRKSKRPQKEKFEKLYYNDEVTAEEIAQIFKVTTSTIYNWAYQFKNEQQ